MVEQATGLEEQRERIQELEADLVKVAGKWVDTEDLAESHTQTAALRVANCGEPAVTRRAPTEAGTDGAMNPGLTTRSARSARNFGGANAEKAPVSNFL